jgi:hypothetical protein
MNWLKIVFYITIGVCFFFLAACSGVSGASLSTPGLGSVDTQSPLTNPPQAALDAQAWLAEHLGVTVDNTKLVDVQHTDWPDSCLGLGGAAESCLQAVTPGWKVVVEVAGTQYEVRASEDGSVIKLVPS